jgi:hypothetical protein
VSGRVVPLGADVHQQVQALLPWYVGASLGEADCARIEAHIAECPRCQAELAWERRLQTDCAQIDAPVGDADRGFAMLRERMAGATATTTSAASAANGTSPRHRGAFVARLKLRWRQSPAWTRWALAAQFALIAALGGLLTASLPPAAQFRALGGPAASPGAVESGNLIVRFRPGATEEDIRRVLRASKARLVYGPTATDAWLLAVPAGLEATAVKQLREEGSVLLVESLDGRAAP